MFQNNIRLYNGVPPASAFGSAYGTPIIIDYTTGKAYFLHPITQVVTVIMGGP